MKRMNETDALNELILLQEQQYDTDLRLLKDQFHIVYESLKPLNLIKKLVHEVATSPEIKEDITSNVIGFITGFISKSLFVNDNSSAIKKVFATILQFAVGNIVSKHSANIKAIGTALLTIFFNKNRK